MVLSNVQLLPYRDGVDIARRLAYASASPSGSRTCMGAFVSRLSGLALLSPAELSLLTDMGRSVRISLPGTEIGSETEPMMARVVVSGWACRQRVLDDGRRQIINLVLPGDIVGRIELPEAPLDESVVTLTKVVTADAKTLARALAHGAPGYPGLATAVRTMALHEAALMRDQVVRLGRFTAYERMVHLVLEMHAKLQCAGLAVDNAFVMPLTQECLADCLGLSPVHVNRTLQQIRRDGLLQMELGWLRIMDMRLMRSVAS